MRKKRGTKYEVHTGKEIGAGFTIALALMAVSTLLAYFKMTNVNFLATRIKVLRTPGALTVQHLIGAMNQSSSKTREYILINDNPELAQRARTDWNKEWERINSECTNWMN